MARPIVLATSNPAKRAQLHWVLQGLPLNPVEVPVVDVPEESPSLAGNASAKALAYSRSGLAIASDGGLEVPALGDRWNPVFTQRQGQARLRELTADLRDRRIRWVEAVALAEGEQLLATWTCSGTEGVLEPEPWPQPADFWVWDIFVFPEIGRHWSQLTTAERERVDITWVQLRRRVQAFLRTRSL